MNAELRKWIDPSKLRFAIVTTDAQAMKQALTSGQPSPIEYPTPKPDAILTEDKLFIGMPLGLKAEDITDVIVTHMHWDHAGGLDLFPKARIWIQQDEYVYYTGEAWQSDGSHGGIDSEDVMALVKANTTSPPAITRIG